jgi:photosynthetic reaction center cytochrome c subunit
MTVRTNTMWAGVASAALVLVAAAIAVDAQTGPAGAQAAPRTAGEAFKNVQVLKDAPAEQLLPTMQFIAASLGVECDFCHVPRAFDKDDKKEKQTARRMMKMMMAINAANFDGDRDVTCYTCHRGSSEPVAIPAIATEEERPEPESAPAVAAPPPAADKLIDAWIQASGGADAIRKVSSRVQKGQMTGFGGRTMPIEIFAKAPNKRISVMQTPRGESITAYDGNGGWMTGREGPHPMTAAESDAARIDADMELPLHLREEFTGFRVRPTEKVGSRDVWLLVAAREGKTPVKLYFDQQTGLLLRQVRYADTALGEMPTQIDYADYRDVDGVKVAFRWTLARPNGRFTISVDSTQQNVPVEDAKFAMPAPPPAPPQQPK